MSVVTDVEVGLELFTELVEGVSEEENCEHRYHGISDLYHEGPGAWYLSSRCPGCSEEQVILVCEKFKNAITSGDRPVQCYACYEHWPVAEMVTFVSKKGR